LNAETRSNVAVILAAAGSGTRLDAGVPKAFASLCGEPLLAHALRGVLGCGQVGHVVVVAPSSHLLQAREITRLECGSDVLVDVVAGGADRSASVVAGLAALRNEATVVLVHDAARCLAPAELFTRVIDSVRAGNAAVVPGIPVTDTIKIVDAQGVVLGTPDRISLRGIQTPQGFLRDVLERAYASGSTATDDAELVEQAGGEVQVIAGDPLAMKVTSQVDLAVAKVVLQVVAHAQ
jgi:2-C-methyl-D-erythritol 4-phosphate cytidylyltransferase